MTEVVAEFEYFLLVKTSKIHDMPDRSSRLLEIHLISVMKNLAGI